MELKDFTIEELQAEIKRRKKEMAAANRKKRVYEYGYVSATVVAVDGDRFTRQTYRLEIDEESKAAVTENFLSHVRHHRFKLLTGAFRKDDAPKLGDRVLLKSLKTKYNPTGYSLHSDPKICKVLED